MEVPTPDGLVTVKVPAGIRSGQSLRLRGKGWIDNKGQRGDQLVKIVIDTPKELTAIERELYEKIKSLPNVANGPCSWRNNPHTRDSSVSVLSY